MPPIGVMQIAMELDTGKFSANVDAATRKLDQFGQAGVRAGRSTVTSVQAASGALRELNGDFSNNIRAVERFITTIPGVGNALKAAFPLIGGLAFGAMIVDMGAKLYDFGKKATDLSRELGTDWLTGAIGQFDGLAKAVKEADDEIANLAKDHDSMAKEFRGDQIGNIRLTRGPAEADRAGASDKRAEAAKDEGMLALVRRDRDSQAEVAKGTLVGFDAFNKPIRDEDNSTALAAAENVKTLDSSIQGFEQKIRNLKLEAANLDLSAAAVKEPKGPRGPGADQVQRQQFDQMKAALDDRKLDEAVSVRQEYDYWEQMKAAFVAGSAGYNDVVHQQRVIASQGARAAHEGILEIVNGQRKELPKDADDVNKALAEGRKGMEEWASRDRNAADEQANTALEIQGIRERTAARIEELSVSDKLDKMDPAERARQLQAIHLQSSNAEMSTLQSQIDLKAASKPESGSPDLDAWTKAMGELQKQMAKLQGDRDVQSTEDDRAIREANRTALDGATGALHEFTLSATNASEAARNFLAGALDRTNGSLVRAMTLKRGERTDFGAAGRDIFTSATGSLLKGAEGEAMKAARLDGSSESNAFWVRTATGLSGAAGTVTHDMGSVISHIGGLFGHKQATAPASSGSGVSLPWVGSSDGDDEGEGSEGSEQSFVGNNGNNAASLASGAFKFAMTAAPLLGFADGGEYGGNSPFWVGEKGRELVIPRGAQGSIVPNHQIAGMGGETHYHSWNIDARGVHDQAQVAATFDRMLAKAAPQIVASSVHAQHIFRGRRPAGSMR